MNYYNNQLLLIKHHEINFPLKNPSLFPYFWDWISVHFLKNVITRLLPMRCILLSSPRAYWSTGGPLCAPWCTIRVSDAWFSSMVNWRVPYSPTKVSSSRAEQSRETPRSTRIGHCFATYWHLFYNPDIEVLKSVTLLLHFFQAYSHFIEWCEKV